MGFSLEVAEGFSLLKEIHLRRMIVTDGDLELHCSTRGHMLQVVQAVRGRVHVLFDGGVRRGTDVFKALALGAKAVLIGRPVIYGLAAKGEYGARHVLEMLRYEPELTMPSVGVAISMIYQEVIYRHNVTG